MRAGIGERTKTSVLVTADGVPKIELNRDFIKLNGYAATVHQVEALLNKKTTAVWVTPHNGMKLAPTGGIYPSESAQERCLFVMNNDLTYVLLRA
jgi:aspartate/methionine/tyrosine aminotransferase